MAKGLERRIGRRFLTRGTDLAFGFVATAYYRWIINLCRGGEVT